MHSKNGDTGRTIRVLGYLGTYRITFDAIHRIEPEWINFPPDQFATYP